jgi:hypothetical protein
MNFIECYGIEEKLLFLQALMQAGHCHFHVQFVRDEAGINKEYNVGTTRTSGNHLI